MVTRQLQTEIESFFQTGKAVVLIGPRQVGKTTLINHLLKEKKHLFLNGDDGTVREILSRANTEELKALIGENKFVFVDEAQRIDGIGLTAKIITDTMKNVQLILSGSSAFELNSEINEPLTGRKWTFELFPISWRELQGHIGYLESTQQLEHRLVYGMYPEVISNFGKEKRVLEELTNSYLFKDILSITSIRKPEVLSKLVKALAFQVGSEVSYNELSQLVQVDKNTVSTYIELLEQAYVVFRLGSFSRNLRNEIKTNQKIYFYDNGVRNMLIGNLNPVSLRNDIGALWENFLLVERLKRNAYNNSLAQTYFWRTHAQQEIDYVEEEAGVITGYEFKWNPKKKAKFPQRFKDTYDAEIKVIHRENFREFIL